MKGDVWGTPVVLFGSWKMNESQQEGGDRRLARQLMKLFFFSVSPSKAHSPLHAPGFSRSLPSLSPQKE